MAWIKGHFEGTDPCEVVGSLIGEFESTQNGKNTKALALSFNQSKSVQAIKKFVGEERTNVLEEDLGSGTEGFGVESTESLALSEGSGQLSP